MQFNYFKHSIGPSLRTCVTLLFCCSQSYLTYLMHSILFMMPWGCYSYTKLALFFSHWLGVVCCISVSNWYLIQIPWKFLAPNSTKSNTFPHLASSHPDSLYLSCQNRRFSQCLSAMCLRYWPSSCMKMCYNHYTYLLLIWFKWSEENDVLCTFHLHLHLDQVLFKHTRENINYIT